MFDSINAIDAIQDDPISSFQGLAGPVGVLDQHVDPAVGTGAEPALDVDAGCAERLADAGHLAGPVLHRDREVLGHAASPFLGAVRADPLIYTSVQRPRKPGARFAALAAPPIHMG